MKRVTYLGLPILLIGILATSSLAQDQPKWKDNKEYEDYMLVWNEKDFPKKAANAEKFFVDHKDADPLALIQVYNMMILSYAQAGNWAKALETADRMNQLAPKLTDADKLQSQRVGMLAAANLKNNPKTIEYAQNVLKMNDKDLNALVTLSSLLSQTLPNDEKTKQTQLTQSLEYTRRALAVPRPQGTADAQWNPIQLQLHQTACLVLLNQGKNGESISECQAALKVNNKDSYSWYLIGLSHKAELVPLVKRYNEATDKYNANRSADQITLDELRSVMTGAEKIASDKKDETLDAFARAVAAGGPAAAEARKELQGLFTGSPEELNRLIEEKKSQLGDN
jgi:pentatricopeptide repeat protein